MASMKGVVAKYNAHLEAMYGGVKAEGAKGLPLSGKIRYILAKNDMSDAQEGPVRAHKKAEFDHKISFIPEDTRQLSLWTREAISGSCFEILSALCGYRRQPFPPQSPLKISMSCQDPVQAH